MSDEKGEIRKDSSEDLLWHFTSCDALPKILLGGDGLLARSTLFMDDHDDSSLSRKLIKALSPVFNFLEQKNSDSERAGNDVLSAIDRHIQAGVAIPSFAICFAKTTDDPTMWQLYTRNGGVAIGIDKKPFVAELENENDDCVKVISKDCDYQSYQALSEKVDAIGLELAQLVNESNEKGNEEKLREHLVPILKKGVELFEQLVFVKRKGFEIEQEFRVAFIHESSNRLKSRLRFVADKPHIAMKMGSKISSFVRQIRISPFGNVAKTRAVAYLVADAIGLSEGQITEGRM